MPAKKAARPAARKAASRKPAAAKKSSTPAPTDSTATREKAADESAEPCGAEIASRFTCDLEAGHDGRHEAPSIDNEDGRVSWAEGSLGYRED